MCNVILDKRIDDSIVESNPALEDFSRLERFKQWATENIGSLSILAVSIAGAITGAISLARQGIKTTKNTVNKISTFLSNIAKKLGPIIGPIFGLLSNILSLGAKGIGFIANNLWLLAIFLTFAITKRYSDEKNKTYKINGKSKCEGGTKT